MSMATKAAHASPVRRGAHGSLPVATDIHLESFQKFLGNVHCLHPHYKAAF